MIQQSAETKILEYPEAQPILIKSLVEFKNKFLQLNQLVLGDKIECHFHFEVLRTKHIGSGMDKFSFSRDAMGILKEDKNGVLYCESEEDFSFFHLTDNGLTGRSRREWYKEEKRKAIRIFTFSNFYQIQLP